MYTASLIFAMLLTQIAPPVIVEEPVEMEEPVVQPPAVSGCRAAAGCPRMQAVSCMMVCAPSVCGFSMPPAPAPIAKIQKTYRNPRTERPFSINFNYAGVALVGFSVTAFVTPTVQVEAGLGPITKYAGVTYHFGGANPRKTWTPYVGLMIGKVHDVIAQSDGGENDTIYGTYMPVGFQYSGRGGFLFAAEAAWVHLAVDGEEVDFPWFGLKFGYRF